jgi:hypothetical protein
VIEPATPPRRASLLHLDSAAALTAAALTGALSPWLASWYSLPSSLLVGTAIANLVYGLYSGWLARRPRPRPLGAIRALALANGAWALVCVLLAVGFWPRASVLGLAHLLLEAVFVGALGLAEWRQQMALRQA